MSYEQPAAAGRRSVGLAVVLLLHALLGYALVTGLARKVVEVIKAPLETKIIEEVKPPEEKEPPPPPPPPKLAPPPPAFVPPPEVRVQPQAAPAETITTVTQTKPTEPVQIAQPAPVKTDAPPAPKRTAAVVDAARNCTKPEYPAAALRAQETGIVKLSFLIGVDGKVVDSKVEKSSGSRRLDEAARKALALCLFKPATENGQAVQDWARLDYEWKIED